VNAANMSRCTTEIALFIALSSGLVACNLTTTSSALVVRNVVPAQTYPYTLRVRTAGGRKTESWRTARVPDTVFLEALLRSLERCGVFARVVTAENADYLLDVVLEDVKEPSSGLDVTVNLSAKWTVKNLKTGQIAYKETIATPYTIGVAEAMVVAQRIQLASEGAARENIREGILRISRLDL